MTVRMAANVTVEVVHVTVAVMNVSAGVDEADDSVDVRSSRAGQVTSNVCCS